MRKQTIALYVLIVLVAAGVGMYGYELHQQHKVQRAQALEMLYENCMHDLSEHQFEILLHGKGTLEERSQQQDVHNKEVAARCMNILQQLKEVAK